MPLLIVVAIGSAVVRVRMPPDMPADSAYTRVLPAAKLPRLPVTGIYPGATRARLNPGIKNPLAGDPDATQRGMRDFDKFNCSAW